MVVPAAMTMVVLVGRSIISRDFQSLARKKSAIYQINLLIDDVGRMAKPTPWERIRGQPQENAYHQ